MNTTRPPRLLVWMLVGLVLALTLLPTVVAVIYAAIVLGVPWPLEAAFLLVMLAAGSYGGWRGLRASRRARQTPGGLEALNRRNWRLLPVAWGAYAVAVVAVALLVQPGSGLLALLLAPLALAIVLALPRYAYRARRRRNP